MSKPALLLIHGMGNFDPPKKDNQGKLQHGTFAKEFISSINIALQRYSNYKTATIDQYIDIHEFNYNAFFDEMRSVLANNAKSMNERLNTLGQKFDLSFAADLAGKLISLEADFKDEKFFYTHWLDVLFYGTLMGDKVRVDAAEKITELVEHYGQGNLHIMAHSLGTAVLHDTLHLLYRREHDPDDNIPDLDLTNHKLASIWMLANVSRLVNSVVHLSNPLKTVVKPGNDGCTNLFFNVRHKMDPITWISRFDPPNNGSWIPENIYNSYYLNIITDLIVDLNTHSFTQYLENPKVAAPFLNQVIKQFKVKTDELNSVVVGYSQKSIQGAYAALEDSFHNLQITDITSWREFLNTAKILQDAIESLRNGF